MSTEVQNFTKEELNMIIQFVKYYDSFNDDLKELESNVQSLLKMQESIIKRLDETRNLEEEFFSKMSEEKNIPMSHLKRLAQAWVTENNNPEN
jgi:hypothetical protein